MLKVLISSVLQGYDVSAYRAQLTHIVPLNDNKIPKLWIPKCICGGKREKKWEHGNIPRKKLCNN